MTLKFKPGDILHLLAAHTVGRHVLFDPTAFALTLPQGTAVKVLKATEHTHTESDGAEEVGRYYLVEFEDDITQPAPAALSVWLPENLLEATYQQFGTCPCGDSHNVIR